VASNLSRNLQTRSQVGALMAVLFAPEEPIYERPLDSHWTDEIAGWWLGFSALAGLSALFGLVADKRRGTAATALLVAFGFAWPWGA